MEGEGPSLSWARILLLAPVAPLLMLVHTLWARRRGLLIAIGVGLLWYYFVHQPAVRRKAEQPDQPAATERAADAGR